MEFKPAVFDPTIYTHHERLVNWGQNEEKDRKKAKDALSKAVCERDMQKFLEENPSCLIHHLGGGHGRWVLPQFRWGSEYVADFIIGEKHSFGHEWQIVELECPTKKMFNKNGDPSATLTHAIRQIEDWRRWLKTNQNYAARPLNEVGLGLLDIDQNCSGLILLGRRHDLTDEMNARRRQMIQTLNIQIRTYDFLCETGGVPISYSLKHLGRDG